MLELKPDPTHLDVECVHSSVRRLKCQQSKKRRERVAAFAPVVTFISGCEKRDGGVTPHRPTAF